MMPHLSGKTHGLMRICKNKMLHFLRNSLLFTPFFANFSSILAFFPTSVVSFFKLDPRLSFTKNRFKIYAFIAQIFQKIAQNCSKLLKNEAFRFLNSSSIPALFQTNVVSSSKLDHRLSFKRTRLQKYACSVEQEPIKVVKLIFEHPVYDNVRCFSFSIEWQNIDALKIHHSRQ